MTTDMSDMSRGMDGVNLTAPPPSCRSRRLGAHPQSIHATCFPAFKVWCSLPYLMCCLARTKHHALHARKLTSSSLLSTALTLASHACMNLARCGCPARYHLPRRTLPRRTLPASHIHPCLASSSFPLSAIHFSQPATHLWPARRIQRNVR